MADIFNEIDEDLRRDQLQKIWDRYSTLILGVAFMIVASVAGWRAYEYWQTQRAMASGDRYYQAVKLSADGDHAGAEAIFRSLTTEGTGGYPVIAGLRAASELALAGDSAAALKAYDQLAAAASTPPTLADVARTRAAYLAVDVEDRAAAEARAAKLDTPTGIWRHSAREVLVLAALKAADVPAAQKRLEQLQNDAEVPRDVAARAEILSNLIRAAAGPSRPGAETAK